MQAEHETLRKFLHSGSASFYPHLFQLALQLLSPLIKSKLTTKQAKKNCSLIGYVLRLYGLAGKGTMLQ